MDKMLTEWKRQDELFELLQTLSKDDADLLIMALEMEYARGYRDAKNDSNRTGIDDA